MTGQNPVSKLFKCLAVLALILIANCACVPPPQDSPPDSPTSPETPGDEITIASFNIQIFGQTKASKPEVMEILADIIRQYDLVAIQEIRDAAETAILVQDFRRSFYQSLDNEDTQTN